MSETVGNIKSSVARWWTAVNADKRPKPNPARMVTVEEVSHQKLDSQEQIFE